MMKRIKSYILIPVLSLMTYYFYHNFFSQNMLIGNYENTNYEYGPFVAELPYGNDIITLNVDNSFSSTYWGNGQYDIEYSISGTQINLSYNYEFGQAGFHSQIERHFFSEPRIILMRDMNHFMRKTKN